MLAGGDIKFPLIIDRSVPCDLAFRREVQTYDGFKHAEVVVDGQRCQFYITDSNMMNMKLWQHYIKSFMDSEEGEILLLCDNHRSHVLDRLIHNRIRMETFYPGSTSLTQVSVANFEKISELS